MLCGEENLNDVNDMVVEINRVLSPGGVYIVISHGVPSTRLAYLQTKGMPWDIEVKEIGQISL